MDFHGITMKGNYFMEQESSPAANVNNEKRLIYNISAVINGSSDQFGGRKMYYHNNVKWLRPLVGNNDDGPDVNNARSLGSNTFRFAGIYSTNFYGAVRYS